MTIPVQFPSTHKWPTVLLLTLLSSCGGGGGGGGNPPSQPSPPPSTSPPPPPPPVVGTVEIEQTGLLLTETGQTRQLRARVIDTNGNPMNVPATWSSSTNGSAAATHISVSSDGVATAVSIGISQIVASAGGIQSAPLLATYNTVASGAILLTDANIVGDPVPTDPNAPPDPANTFDVTLTGVAAPVVGEIVVNTESKIVAGRVTAAVTSGTETKVTLEQLPIPELFPELEFREVIDLSRTGIAFEGEILSEYNIERVGNSYSFTPKPTAQKISAFKPTLLKCKSDQSLGGDIELVERPKFTLTLDPTLDIELRRLTGVERFVLAAKPKLDAQVKLKLTGNLAAKVGCEWYLGILRPPIGGPLGYVIGMQFPVGLEFEASAQASSPTLLLGAKLDVSSSAQFGVNCSSGVDCELVRNFEQPTVNFEPLLEVTPAVTRFEPTVGIGVFIRTQAGLLLFESTKLEAFKLQAGVAFSGDFATRDGQIADPIYRSKYELKAALTLSAGAQLTKWTNKLFGEVALGTGLELYKAEASIGASPTGTIKSSKQSFGVGEAVTIEANLENTGLISLLDSPYMISRVLLVRKVGSVSTLEDSIVATTGQKRFVFQHVPTQAGSASEYFIFVVPRLFEALELEIGRAAANTLEIFHVTSVCTPVTQWVERTGFNGAQVRTFNDRICSGTAAGRNLRACRYNGVWLAKRESRNDLVHATRDHFPGSYEWDEFSVTADGTFELHYEYGWNETRETATHTITNFREARYHARGNPITQQAGGEFYRKIDTTTVSKVPTQTGTYRVTTLEANFPFVNEPPGFGGRFSIDPVGGLPVRIENRGVVDESEIPAECTGDSPYTPLY